MRLRLRSLSTLAIALAVLQGCAAPAPPTVMPGGYDATLRPAQAVPAMPRLAGGIRLRLDDATRATVVTVHKPRTLGQVQVVLAIGQIIEGVALAALADEFEPAAPGSGTFVLALSALRFDVDDHLTTFVPIPLPAPLGFAITHVDIDTRLWLDVTLIDPQGRLLWTRTYDSGRKPPATGPQGVTQPGSEFLPAALVQRVAHEQAFSLLQKAARDVRRWVEMERPRVPQASDSGRATPPQLSPPRVHALRSRTELAPEKRTP